MRVSEKVTTREEAIETKKIGNFIPKDHVKISSSNPVPDPHTDK